MFGMRPKLTTALEGDNLVEFDQHCREANKSLTSQFNTKQSAGTDEPFCLQIWTRFDDAAP